MEIFRKKLQGTKAGKLKSLLIGRERKTGLMMAALVLTAAAIFGYGGRMREAASSEVKSGNPDTVIVDAGHGGDDPGKIGVDGVLEKDLNLAMALRLRELLGQQDLDVVMTREGDEGLYDRNAVNKKVQDMKNRCARINREQPACVVSIHQNSYHEEPIHGAQVFYYETSKESRRLAEILQKELVRVADPENHRKAKANDTYYLLKKTEVPVVIVECGFLSNWEECTKLQKEEYQEKLMWAVHMGILKYINGNM